MGGTGLKAATHVLLCGIMRGMGASTASGLLSGHTGKGVRKSTTRLGMLSVPASDRGEPEVNGARPTCV